MSGAFMSGAFNPTLLRPRYWPSVRLDPSNVGVRNPKNKVNIANNKNSEHPESNQGPFDSCSIYSRTLYQLSYVRFHNKPNVQRVVTRPKFVPWKDTKAVKATPVGFEPTRAEPTGLAGRRLNHSAKASSARTRESHNSN